MGFAKFYVREISKDGKSRNSRKLMSRNLMFAKIYVLKVYETTRRFISLFKTDLILMTFKFHLG